MRRGYERGSAYEMPVSGCAQCSNQLSLCFDWQMYRVIARNARGRRWINEVDNKKREKQSQNQQGHDKDQLLEPLRLFSRLQWENHRVPFELSRVEYTGTVRT